MKELNEEVTQASKRVLVLDDDRAIRKTIVEVLERAGFNVDSGCDGEEGWQALAATQYDLVVTDLDMPTLCGFDLLCRMRAAGMNCPVVLVTGSRLLDARIAEVFEAVLFKPFFLYELVVTIQRVITQNARAARMKHPTTGHADRAETLHSV
jgi:DNA-binding response OmpR family regulator